jgi:hypothetical protein
VRTGTGVPERRCRSGRGHHHRAADDPSLVPAAMTLMGDASWWIPRWLDRPLPAIDVQDPAAAPMPETEADPHPDTDHAPAHVQEEGQEPQVRRNRVSAVTRESARRQGNVLGSSTACCRTGRLAGNLEDDLAVLA